MNTKALSWSIDLMEKTVCGVNKPVYTCNQFLLTLLVVQNDGMTQRQLADRLGVDDSTVLRAYRKMGPKPEGSGCLYKRGNKIVASDHVIKCLAEHFEKFGK